MRTQRPRRASPLEESLALQIRAHRLPVPQREFRFSTEQLFRFDFAFVDERIAVECEGGTWVKGAHSRGKHFESDCEKYNLAVCEGWRIVRFTTDMVADGRAIQTLKRLFNVL